MAAKPPFRPEEDGSMRVGVSGQVLDAETRKIRKRLSQKNQLRKKRRGGGGGGGFG